MVKTDSSGNVQWSKTYNNSARASSVALADDGGYVLVATDSAGKPVIIKTGSSGDEEWRETAGLTGEAATVQKTADGGYAASGTSGGDLYLMKLKAPVKASNSLFLNNGGLFSRMDLFKFGSTDDSATDLGQATTTGNSLFGPSTLKMFNLIEDADEPAIQYDSPFKFSSIPSFDFKNTGKLTGDDFPKITASFGDSGWPFN